MPSMARLLLALRRRILRRFDVIIVRCINIDPRPPALDGLRLVRMSRRHGIDLDAVATVLRRSGELDVDAPARFAQGDEFFGLQDADGIVCFRWATFGERHEGRARILPKPDRAVLYNVFTLESHRGQGLSTLLMRHVQALLAHDGRTDFVAGVNARNAASCKALANAGFSAVATVSELVVLDRFRLLPRMSIHEPAARELFLDERSLPPAANANPSAPDNRTS